MFEYLNNRSLLNNFLWQLFRKAETIFRVSSKMVVYKKKVYS